MGAFLLPSLLQWLKRLCGEPRRDVAASFNDAEALLAAGNHSDALLRFCRVLQLEPNHEQALVRRQRLAIDLGLVELDRAAGGMGGMCSALPGQNSVLSFPAPG